MPCHCAAKRVDHRNRRLFRNSLNEPFNLSKILKVHLAQMGPRVKLAKLFLFSFDGLP